MDKRREKSEETRLRYRELLEELRTIIPGAQVLFAFLLSVPFAARFSGVDRLGKVIFTISILLVAAATVLFLAPAAYHRLASRHDRRGRLHFGIRTTLVGLLFLGLSMACAVFVVVRFLFGIFSLAIILATATMLMAGLLWYYFPIRNSRKRREESEAEMH